MNETISDSEVKAIIELNSLIDKITQVIKSINVFDVFKVHRIFPKGFDLNEITDITVYDLRYSSTDKVDDNLISKITDFNNIHDYAQNVLSCLIYSGWLDYALPILKEHCKDELRKAVLNCLPQGMVLNTINGSYCADFKPIRFYDNQFTVELKKIRSTGISNWNTLYNI